MVDTKLVLFFNAAQESGTSSDIYYVDDIRFTNSTNNFPIISDFESLNPSVPLQVTFKPYQTHSMMELIHQQVLENILMMELMVGIIC